MRKGLSVCLFMMALMSTGLFAPAALAADDDGMGLLKEQAPAGAAATRSVDTELPVAHYLVTFIKSRTTDPIRTATVVSVTNQAEVSCEISVEWFRGFITVPDCTTTILLDAGVQADFCSRAIPESLTTCNTTCAPDLTFHEGRAVVSSSKGVECQNIGVSARVYYTTGSDDNAVSAISDSKIVPFSQGNRGD